MQALVASGAGPSSPFMSGGVGPSYTLRGAGRSSSFVVGAAGRSLFCMGGGAGRSSHGSWMVVWGLFAVCVWWCGAFVAVCAWWCGASFAIPWWFGALARCSWCWALVVICGGCCWVLVVFHGWRCWVLGGPSLFFMCHGAWPSSLSWWSFRRSRMRVLGRRSCLQALVVVRRWVLFVVGTHCRLSPF